MNGPLFSFVGVPAVLCGLFLAVFLVSGAPLHNPIILAMIWFIFAAVAIVLSARKKSRQDMENAVTQAATTHAAALARKRSQLLSKDDYGREKRDNWDREIDMFLNEIVKPSLRPGAQEALLDNLASASARIDEIAEAEQSKRVGATAYRDDLNPKEFEVYCATTLTRAGWSARATGQTGDQGADVLAEKGGWLVVIQCKKYTGSVGNSAVQEAHAAKAHYAAHIAVVVTNASFTTSAKALAQTTGVILMHPTDLADFDTRVFRDVRRN